MRQAHAAHVQQFRLDTCSPVKMINFTDTHLDAAGPHQAQVVVIAEHVPTSCNDHHHLQSQKHQQALRVATNT